MDTPKPTADCLLDSAITLALTQGWHNFTLSQLAHHTHCTLIDIKKFYRSKDDMAEALFDRADNAMLQLTDSPAFQNNNSDQRTIECILCWLSFLAPYKAIVKDILLYKFEPGHFHLQAHGITRVSRTVQWFREVSGRTHSGLSQVVDEIAITHIYLATVLVFLNDNSRQHNKTRAFVTRLITTTTPLRCL